MCIRDSYVTPNNALANGDIDLNAFQHRIYLQNEIDNYGYEIQNIGNTFITVSYTHLQRRHRRGGDPPDGGRV